MIEHTNDTTPATPSQHPRTDEGACEREVETLRRLLDDSTQVRNLVLAELEAEQAAHVLDVQIFESGAREMAAMLDSTRARITEIVDAVKAERECETALDMAKETSNYASWDSAWRKWQDAKALTDAMVRKHEGVSVVGESISYEALHREGWAQDENGLNWPINGCDSVSWDFDDETVFVSSPVTGWMKAPGARTMADIHTLVRLFTAPDEAGTR